MRVLRGAVLCVAAAVALAGCIVDGSLDPSGAGRLTLRYRLVSVAHFDSAKPRLQSPDVSLVGASTTPDKWATYEMTTPDVRKLSTAPALAGTTVSLTDEPDGLRTLAVTMEPLSKALPEQYLIYLGREFRLRLTLPGDVVRSNATTATGRTASWTLPLDRLVGEERQTFTATFRAPAPAAPPPA
jgi:hypothetical protein